jgi:hypothetical protein
MMTHSQVLKPNKTQMVRMSPCKGYSRDEVLRRIQEFARESGRPPRRNEPGFQRVVSAAEKKFGSWQYALRIAGLQTYKSWRKKDTFAGKLCILLNNSPMTMKEIRLEIEKNERALPPVVLSQKVSTTIQQTKEIHSIGPRRAKVYYLEGQENLAKTHLNQPISLDEKQDFIFSSLSKPMTKNEILNLFQEETGTKTTERLLKELVFAKLVAKIRFVAGNKGSRYNSMQLFGKLAGKTYFFRIDDAEQLVDLIIQNLPPKDSEESRIAYSITHHLKRMLPSELYSDFLKKKSNLKVDCGKSANSRLDGYLQ